MSKPKKIQIRNSTAEFLVFTTQAGEKGIEVRVEDETVWLTQKLIGVLFNVTVPTVSEHLKNIFSEGEVQEDSVVRKFRTTASDGKSYLTAFYSLDAIIAVGFRVNSTRATQFRQERLKNGVIIIPRQYVRRTRTYAAPRREAYSNSIEFDAIRNQPDKNGIKLRPVFRVIALERSSQKLLNLMPFQPDKPCEPAQKINH